MKTDLPYGYCGMPCALCTRYRTEGKSRCPGCSHDGYYTDVCKVHHCCKEKCLAQCGLCEGYPCVRLGNMGDFHDLDTGGAKKRNSERIASEGFESWYREYALRAELLTEALAKYNNGRMKRFLCETCIRQDIEILKEILLQAENLQGTPKDVCAAFRKLAEERIEKQQAVGAKTDVDKIETTAE